MIASGYETLHWIVVIIRRSSGLVVDSTGITESFASIRTRSYPWSNVSAVDANGEFVHLSLRTRYFPLKFKPSVSKASKTSIGRRKSWHVGFSSFTQTTSGDPSLWV